MIEKAQSAPIRTLLVEDDPVFAGVVMATLSIQETHEFHCRHATTLAEARTILADEKIDGVLADLDLPDSSGLDTLTALLAVRRLPIVVITGSDYVALARQSLEAGAQDYLVKGDDRGRHVARALVHAIERHRQLKTLAFSEQRFRDFAEVSSDWLWEIDADFRFAWISDNVRDVLGIDPIGMIGRRFVDTIGSDQDADKVMALSERLQAREPFRNVTFRPAEAPERQIRASGKPAFSPSGRFLGYRGASSDVSQEMESQAFAARTLSVLLGSLAAFPNGIMIFDDRDCLVSANERAGQLMPSWIGHLLPGRSFIEILGAAASGGGFSNAQGRVDDWLDDWRRHKAREPGTLSEPTSAGATLYFHQYLTETGGMLRIVRYERGAGPDYDI